VLHLGWGAGGSWALAYLLMALVFALAAASLRAQKRTPS
jgi:hypothetical protein